MGPLSSWGTSMVVSVVVALLPHPAVSRAAVASMQRTARNTITLLDMIETSHPSPETYPFLPYLMITRNGDVYSRIGGGLR